MDLKEFIKETISGIVFATTELQADLESAGVIVNPPVSLTHRDLYQKGGATHTYRRVEIVEFDVAVTAASETGGGGKAGLKVLSFEAGADGRHTQKSEEVSRVKFSIPIALAPSKAEAENRDARDSMTQRATEAAKNRSGPSIV